MYLTHIDEDGNDTPAILIEDATDANRAVNIPEFVNIPPDGLRKIGGPAIEYYRLVDRAEYLRKQGQYQESISEWEKVLKLKPDDSLAHSTLGALLLMTGHPEEAAAHLRRAKELRQDESGPPH
jgi:tetratricopeptide (TPR) repeat protein